MEREPKKKDEVTNGKTELPKRETDYPHRHSGQIANQKVVLESMEEVERWFELEGKTDTLHLGR